MQKFKTKGQKWLKGFHIIFACVWVSCTITLSVIQFLVNPSDGRELYGIIRTINLIDYIVLIPGALGVLLTALIYSIWTNWGWIKHKWIAVKWIICIYGIIFGSYALAPWQTKMTRISLDKGMEALMDPTFLHSQKMLVIFGTLHAAILVFAVFLAALKPWEKEADKDK